VSRQGGLIAEARALAAMGRANACYWSSVLTRVHRGLRHWEERARQISDPSLRELALHKITHERFNTEVAATLATLAPRPYRAQAVDAIVALQVMYDYLDGLSEEPAPDPLGNSRRLFSAFTLSLTPEHTEPVDYYRDHPHEEDGGYLPDLVFACQQAFAQLPKAEVVAPAARRAAQRCGESQTRTHAIEALGVAQLSEWAAAAAEGTGMSWWEYTAGGTASILSVHALVAAAADERTTTEEADDLDVAYLYIATISTLLDSLIDHSRDREEGNHSFIDYYAGQETMVERIEWVISRAANEGGRIDNSGHHRMTAAGVAAYYLSAPAASKPPGRSVKADLARKLPLLGVPALGVFRLWRIGKAIAARR